MDVRQIRATYESRIDNLMSDLEMFATGAYLSEGEEENWFEPLDVKRIPAVHNALGSFLESALANGDDLLLARTDVINLYRSLDAINGESEAPVVEEEEIQDFEDMLRDLYADLGMSANLITDLPTYDEYLDNLSEDESY